MKNVIYIYGASGSGTSTLGRKISEELGYKFMDTDDYFWLPTNPRYTTKRSKEERLALMKKDISENDNVVISGSLVDWGDELIPGSGHPVRFLRISGDPNDRKAYLCALWQPCTSIRPAVLSR